MIEWKKKEIKYTVRGYRIFILTDRQTDRQTDVKKSVKQSVVYGLELTG